MQTQSTASADEFVPDSDKRPAALSWLACVETAIATGASVWFAVYSGHSSHLLIASLAAPLLLLRSQQSSSIAAALFVKCEPIFRPRVLAFLVPRMAVILGMALSLAIFALQWSSDGRMPSLTILAFAGAGMVMVFVLLFPILWACLLALLSTLIRTLATLYALLTNLNGSVLAVPINWQNLCFRVDFRQVPELFPGVSSDPRLAERYAWGSYLRQLQVELDNFLAEEVQQSANVGYLQRAGEVLFNFMQRLALSSCIAAAGLLLMLVAAAYRLSVKSTCLIYLPLLYLGDPAFRTKQPRGLFYTIRRSTLARGMAAFVIVSHIIVTIAVALVVGAAAYAQQKTLIADLIGYWSFTPVLSANTLAKLLNAGLVFVSIPLATLGIRQAARGNPRQVDRIGSLLRLVLVTRAALTIYSILYVIVLISYHVTAQQVTAGLEVVVDFLQSVRIDWTLLPKRP